ncbi:MAG: M23 family metallopeptidase [Marinicaulis sp.]|nr:M23 family metallopeptidase [Marinicaulis sp.]
MSLVFAGCATAPQQSVDSSKIVTLNIPEQTRVDKDQRAALPLQVCPGMHVSNAPGADANRRLVNYRPYSRVHGVTLATAPVDACLSSGFGPRRGGASSHHNGVDLYTRTPTPIYAAGDGRVNFAATMRGYGRVIEIAHSNRIKSRYAHLSSFAQNLRVGDRIREGDLIGFTGATGNATAVHLHYEILVDGRPRNPLAASF